ncbi:hypothetical protein AX17_002443 [Amanita inopinata Kibby_2008]|nr:hypothetical protein AX17_002443 [Amanita inopinata Kibby_2008]
MDMRKITLQNFHSYLPVQLVPAGVITLVASVVIYKLYERIHALDKLCSSLDSSNTEQREQMEKLHAELDEMTEKVEAAARDAKTKQNAWSTRAVEITNLQTRLARSQNEHEQLKTRHTRDIQIAREEVRAVHSQKGEMKNLLDSQATELAAAREFTFMTDSVSAADVVRMVQELNSAIYQTTMQLVSIFPLEAAEIPPADQQLNVEARGHAINAIGERLVKMLTSEGSDESLLILAFQSGLAYISTLALSSWLYGMDREARFLKDVYQQIWTSEKQAVAGRWRALTHKKLSALATPPIRPDIISVLRDILLTIGWKDEPQNITLQIEEELGDSVDEIIETITKTSKAIREEFISEDLLAVHFRSGSPFKPMSMEVEGIFPTGQARRNGAQYVLGTVEIGLATFSRNTGTQLLLKPKVTVTTIDTSTK